MPKKTLGTIILIIGIVVLLVSLFADPIGIGGYPGIGSRQLIGIIIGLVIAIVGFILRRK